MSFNNKTKYDGAGVYAIICIKELKAYVGSSKNIKNRMKQHKTALLRGNHPIKALQKDFDNRYSFDFVLLEKGIYTDSRLLLFKEYCYMYQLLNDDFELYNISGCRGKNLIEKNSNLEKIIACRCSVLFCNDTHMYLDKVYHGLSGYKISKSYRERHQNNTR